MDIFGLHLPRWCGHILVVAGPLLAGLLLRAIAVRNTRHVEHSPARVFGNYLLLWSILLGGHLLLTRVDFPPAAEGFARKGIVLLFIASAVFFLSKVLVAVLNRWTTKVDAIRTIQSPVRFSIRLGVAILGALIALDVLSIPITPLITTLGIGGIAFALAIQDTLSNFFSGILLAVDQPVLPGQYVRIDSGEEGCVLEIGWRSTRLRTPQNNVVIIPNSKLAHTSIVNYDLPERRFVHTFRIIAELASDSRKVEGAIADVLAEAAGKIDGFLESPRPGVRFSPGVVGNGLEFTAVVHLRSVDDRSVEDELRHRILERFRREGILLPAAAVVRPT